MSFLSVLSTFWIIWLSQLWLGLWHISLLWLCVIFIGLLLVSAVSYLSIFQISIPRSCDLLWELGSIAFFSFSPSFYGWHCLPSGFHLVGWGSPLPGWCPLWSLATAVVHGAMPSLLAHISPFLGWSGIWVVCGPWILFHHRRCIPLCLGSLVSHSISCLACTHCASPWRGVVALCALWLVSSDLTISSLLSLGTCLPLLLLLLSLWCSHYSSRVLVWLCSPLPPSWLISGRSCTLVGLFQFEWLGWGIGPMGGPCCDICCSFSRGFHLS